MSRPFTMFIWFCASGYSFFVGIFLLIAAVIISMSCKKLVHKIILHIFTLISVTLIFFSSTPLPIFLWAIWIIACAAWLYLAILRRNTPYRLRIAPSLSVIFVSLISFGFEFAHNRLRQTPLKTFEQLYVIGDSVSAGIGRPSEKPWPRILADEHHVDVVNLSVPGATVESAQDQAKLVASGNCLILLEIGGNNVLESTPPESFAQSLQELIETVKSPGNEVLMLELPVLPWDVEYIKIQRKLSDKLGVILIPKSFFVKIITTQGAISDLAHLTPSGHKKMAESIWELIKDYFKHSKCIKRKI